MYFNLFSTNTVKYYEIYFEHKNKLIANHVESYGNLMKPYANDFEPFTK